METQYTMNIIWIMISAYVLCNVHVESICPAVDFRCNCTYKDSKPFTLHCSNMGLVEKVPEFLMTDDVLEILEFNMNTTMYRVQANSFIGIYMKNLKLDNLSIEVLEPSAFDGLWQYLEGLYLGNNRIADIPKIIFAEMSNLKYLHLQNNRLKNLDPSVFFGLINLEALYLQDNFITQIPDICFVRLNNLVSLHLDRNNLTDLQPILFNNKKKLNDLYLEGNRLKDLNDNVFVELQALQRLVLSNNSITKLSPGLIKNNTLLKHIELSGNQLLDIPVGFLNSTLNLEYLDMSHNFLEKLNATMFSNLTKLIYVLLQGNRIQSLENQIFRNLQQLQILNVSNNLLTSLTFQTLYGLSALKELHLQNNKLQEIPYGTFSHLVKLQLMDLSRNNIEKFALNPFVALRNLEQLDLSYNKLDGLTRDMFETQAILKWLSLCGNRISAIQFETFHNLQNMEMMDLSQNKINELQDLLFSKMNKLRFLNLNSNPIFNLTNGTFVGLESLVELHMSNTCLSDIGEMLNPLENIQNLSMRDNNFFRIFACSFNHQGSMKVLDLTNSNLHEIENGGYVANLHRLYIAENPLTCSCVNAWLRSKKAIIKSISIQYCLQHHNQYLNLCFPQDKCNQNWNNNYEDVCQDSSSYPRNINSTSKHTNAWCSMISPPTTLAVDVETTMETTTSKRTTLKSSPATTTDTDLATEETTPIIAHTIHLEINLVQIMDTLEISWVISGIDSNYIEYFVVDITYRITPSYNLTYKIHTNKTSAVLNFERIFFWSLGTFNICVSLQTTFGTNSSILGCEDYTYNVSMTTMRVKHTTQDQDFHTTTEIQEFGTTSSWTTTKVQGFGTNYFSWTYVIVISVTVLLLIVILMSIMTCICLYNRPHNHTDHDKIASMKNSLTVGPFNNNGTLPPEELVEQTTLTISPRDQYDFIHKNGLEDVAL